MSDARNQSRSAQPNPKMPTRGKVLCVFDDAQLVRHLEPAVMAADYTLLRARHGMHGYWVALTGHPEVILTDVTDPTRETDYLLECLKRNPKTRSIPVVALVDAAQQTAAAASCLKHVTLCLNKHAAPEDILKRVRGLLEGEPTFRIDPDPDQARNVDAVFSELGHARPRNPRIVAKFLKSQQVQGERATDSPAL